MCKMEDSVILAPCPDCGDASPDLSVSPWRERLCAAAGKTVYEARASLECPTCGRYTVVNGSSVESMASAELDAARAAVAVWAEQLAVEDDEAGE